MASAGRGWTSRSESPAYPLQGDPDVRDGQAVQQVLARRPRGTSPVTAIRDDHEERDQQRRVWRDAAVAIRAAVTHYERSKGLNRYEVEKRLRQVVRRPERQPDTQV